MIRDYNTKETLRGCGCMIAGIVGYGCAWLFFRHGPEFVLGGCGIHPPDGPLWISTAAILCLITASGYRRWSRGGGFQSYHESGLYNGFDLSSSGARVADHYLQRVTGPAFVLTQLFLAGPMMILRGVAHFRNRIPPDDILDRSLHDTLAMLRGLNKWQSLQDHPGLEQPVLLLAKMGKLDFSSARGPRFRAYPDDHRFPETSDD